MKLGRKKSDEAATETAGQPAGKQKLKSREAKGPRLKRLGAVAGVQAAAVLLAGLLAAALLYLLVLGPAELRRADSLAAQEVVAAASRMNQHLAVLQSAVEGLAVQRHVREALDSGEGIDAVAEELGRTLPDVRAVHLFPYGDIPRRTGGSDTLGFAGLDLARRAESGKPLHPDAFPRDGQWYFQMAAAIRKPENRAMAGSMLVVFDASELQPLLAVNNRELGGKMALVQSVNGSSRVVVSRGTGSGDTVEQALAAPGWSLSYQPASLPAPVLNAVLAMILILVPALVAAIVVWVVLGNAQRSLRQDISVLTQWAHKVFSGERLKLPVLKWDLVASMGEVLHRLSRMVDKRVVKKGESTRSGTPEGEDSATDEPLFQDKDMLDIDMLDGDDDVLGLGSGADDDDSNAPAVEEVTLPQVDISAGIFRAYDIRGIVGETLSEEIVQVIGRAIGSEAAERGIDSLCIGYDGRHSSPDLADALARGIMSAGCNVIHVGAVPTPVLYFATHHLQTGSGVMVTGSHNPANYNGLKIMLGGDTLSGDAIQKLYQRTQTGDLVSGQGAQSSEDVRRAYLDRIVGDIAVAAPLKVVLDAGNGIAGELAPILVEELGCEVIPLYCEVDGDFPNHHPDPGKPDNLVDLIARVKSEQADIGLAFDGDGDRLGVVTNSGKIIWPDRLLMLFARDVVSRNPGADVLYDVKCSRRLAGVISEAGGRPIMWKTGHSLMKAKMKETGALLAGEMSGHIFFGERWYGFDDGLYSAARLLEILGVEDRHSDEVFEDFPEDISTPELNVEVTEDSKFQLVERLGSEGKFGDGSISTIDGIRVDYADGWGLCRASNTTPVLVLRFEAETEEALERIKSVFRDQLKIVAPDLRADF
ncbi:phosphomannomutase [Marinobacter lipolyticus SM19]|uniref:phosphomannomutase n=1 Tax=Marinobacter lipolyticus SM19 TaxID=1318628 RepID=R8B4K5_9GAMM|nr:phosphomannomutase/phosphoglucomutase [Marinobacter lipolyticus]EON93459.1 phosphomannomutase [Marinobacter lipolyticus SM19]